MRGHKTNEQEARRCNQQSGEHGREILEDHGNLGMRSVHVDRNYVINPAKHHHVN
jgi:hypothetical protein